MTPREALHAGDVQTATSLLKAEIRQAPRDARLRTFLFQLLCITGEWDRALTQLALAGELDPLATPMVQTYEILIRCEILRERTFAGTRTPTVLGDPGPWLPLLIEATRLLATGQPEQAATLRDQALEAAPATPATINGTHADWVADADPRLGPTIDAIVEGKYVWIPYDRIQSITLDPPQDLRDQVWTPATFTWTNDGQVIGFIPTRYPGTTASTDPTLLLARRTEFTEIEHWSIPIGQRMIATPDAEYPLLDLRHLQRAPLQSA